MDRKWLLLGFLYVTSQCNLEPNFDYNGNDLYPRGKRPTAADAVACCALCQQDGLCQYFTWNEKGGTCNMKSSKAGRKACKAVVSGDRGGPAQPTPAPTPLTSRPWFNRSLSSQERAESLVGVLTNVERIEQLIIDAPAIPRAGVPAYMWRNNVLHGLVDNGISTQFPQATGMAATWDTEMLRKVGQICGTEQRAKHNLKVKFDSIKHDSPMNYGLDLWGPNINMLRDSRWGRGQETYGECPTLTGNLAASFIKGLQNEGGPLLTVATPKHFDAYSVDKMPPRLSFDPNISEADLHQYYYPAFRKAVFAGAKSIMCAYNGINGYPSCMSPLIQQVLRGEMGFDGYVVTDSGAVKFMVEKFHRFSNITDAAAASFNAGVDLNSGHSFAELGPALATGVVNETRLKQGLSRLFKARIELGLFDTGNSGPFDQLGAADIASPAHIATALAVAQESIVLLKNDKNEYGHGHYLPLNLTSSLSVAVIGPAADDTYRMLGNYYGCSTSTWGPVLQGCNVSTPLAAIRRDVESAGGTVQYARGCGQESKDTSGFAEALNASKRSDVVVLVLGLRNCQGGQGKGGRNCESEGHDRAHIQLPGMQGELLKVLVQESGKPVVLVLLNGGPVSTPFAAENATAIVEAWYGGSEGGNALSNVLFGRTSPAGRLPFSIVKSVSDLPPDLDMDPTAAPHGRTYRYFNDTPLYNFGFGLSYTTHNYSDFGMPSVVHASKDRNVTACCTVTNTGSFLSQEVVQLYATRRPDPPVQAASDTQTHNSNLNLSHVPRVQLVSFTRTAAISPGDALRVCLPVDIGSLRLWDGSSFAMQPGTYSFFIGPSAPGLRGMFVDESAISKPLTQDVKII